MADIHDHIKILKIPYPHNLQARCMGIFHSEDTAAKFCITESCTDRANLLIIDGFNHFNFCHRCAKRKYPEKEKELAIYDHKA